MIFTATLRFMENTFAPQKPDLNGGGLFANLGKLELNKQRETNTQLSHDVSFPIPAIRFRLYSKFYQVDGAASRNNHLHRNRASFQTCVYELRSNVLCLNISPNVAPPFLKTSDDAFQPINGGLKFIDAVRDSTVGPEQMRQPPFHYFAAADNLIYQDGLSVQINRTLSQSIIQHMIILFYELVKLILNRLQGLVSSEQGNARSSKGCKRTNYCPRKSKPIASISVLREIYRECDPDRQREKRDRRPSKKRDENCTSISKPAHIRYVPSSCTLVDRAAT